MNSASSTFLDFVNSEKTSSSATDLIGSAWKFLEREFPQIKTQPIIHVESPDCYQLFDKINQSVKSIELISKVNWSEIEKSDPFLATKKLLLLPIRNHKEVVEYIFLLIPSLIVDQKKLNETCTEI